MARGAGAGRMRRPSMCQSPVASVGSADAMAHMRMRHMGWRTPTRHRSPESAPAVPRSHLHLESHRTMHRTARHDTGHVASHLANQSSLNTRCYSECENWLVVHINLLSSVSYLPIPDPLASTRRHLHQWLQQFQSDECNCSSNSKHM